MPAPLAPLAWTALRLGTVAAVAIYVQHRRRGSQPKNVFHDLALNETPEGIDLSTHRAEGEAALQGAGRWRRVLRAGRNGRAVEIDAAILGRLRFRRVE